MFRDLIELLADMQVNGLAAAVRRQDQAGLEAALDKCTEIACIKDDLLEIGRELSWLIDGHG